jgi:hypothetical protein
MLTMLKYAPFLTFYFNQQLNFIVFYLLSHFNEIINIKLYLIFLDI